MTLHLDLVENGPTGNRAIINYNNSEGWKKYYSVSDRYAQPIIRLVRVFKDKDELQRDVKKLIHKIDIECFGVKYQKSKPNKIKNMNKKNMK